ncbi:hypothetical protein SCWH03_25900 [Streptomyces pacificus]|uniref:Uncharacterized protein n=1 Tax=Streptomyces pacificus TaxID=2705029 RepID=A0A6A0ATY0_9ACTN|nr:hypothetical protein SCWH03_25900 [Streptomyces pacificus]
MLKLRERGEHPLEVAPDLVVPNERLLTERHDAAHATGPAHRAQYHGNNLLDDNVFALFPQAGTSLMIAVCAHTTFPPLPAVLRSDQRTASGPRPLRTTRCDVEGLSLTPLLGR